MEDNENIIRQYYEIKSVVEILKNDFAKSEELNKHSREKLSTLEQKLESMNKSFGADIEKLFGNDTSQMNNLETVTKNIFDEMKKTKLTFSVNKTSLMIFGMLIFILISFYDKMISLNFIMKLLPLLGL